MSLAALTWAMAQTAGGAVPKAILVMLANLADDQGRAWPSTIALASASEANLKSVKTALARLIAAGLIEDTGDRVGGTGRVRVFRLCMSGTETVRKQTQKRVHSTDAKQTQKRVHSETEIDPKTTIKWTQKRVANTKGHETINTDDLFGAREAKPKPKRGTKSSAPAVEYPNWWPHDEWEAFVKARNERKNWISNDARKILVEDFAAFHAAGGDVRQSLRDAIAGGYQKPVMKLPTGSHRRSAGDELAAFRAAYADP